MTDKALYGSPERPGMLTLMDRTARSVERVEKRLDEWDLRAVTEDKERKSQRNGIVLLALSGLITGLLGILGWLGTWAAAKVAGKVP